MEASKVATVPPTYPAPPVTRVLTKILSFQSGLGYRESITAGKLERFAPLNRKTVCKAACPDYANYERDLRSDLGFQVGKVCSRKSLFAPLVEMRICSLSFDAY